MQGAAASTELLVDRNMQTVLITNGNLLSLLSLGDFLRRFHSRIAAVFLTTRLPSQKSNVAGVLSMFRESGFSYTHFKLLTNVLLPRRLRRQGLPTTVPDYLRQLGSAASVIEAPDINSVKVLQSVKRFEPEILLSFSATTRFSDDLVRVPSRVALNAHYALLPAYAGLSPYFWYLHNLEAECGVTLHRIVSRLDAGPIIEQQRFNMRGLTTVFGVLRRQTECISPMLVRFYEGRTSELDAKPQDLNRRTYFRHPTRKHVRQLMNHGHSFHKPEDIDAVKSRLEELARTTGRANRK